MTVRAEELFALCDKENKGFIIKRDMQRLQNELDFSSDELELVFDSLDAESNGFLTVEEFAIGLRHCMESRKDKYGSLNVCHEDHFYLSEMHCEEELQKFLHELNCPDEEDTLKVVWHHFRQGDGIARNLFEELLGRIFEKIRSKDKEKHMLEEYWQSKKETYKAHVERLTEEMEQHIKLSNETATRKARTKEQDVIRELRAELRGKDSELHELSSQVENLQQVLHLVRTDYEQGKEKNHRLSKTKARLEYQLENTKLLLCKVNPSTQQIHCSASGEGRQRVRAASSVRDNIIPERESLMTQLSLLRSINTMLSDVKDFWQLSARTRDFDERETKVVNPNGIFAVISNGNVTNIVETQYLKGRETLSLSLHDELSMCLGKSSFSEVVKQGLKEQCVQPSNEDADRVTLPGYDYQIQLGNPNAIRAAEACNAWSSLTQMPPPKGSPVASNDYCETGKSTTFRTERNVNVATTATTCSDNGIRLYRGDLSVRLVRQLPTRNPSKPSLLDTSTVAGKTGFYSSKESNKYYPDSRHTIINEETEALPTSFIMKNRADQRSDRCNKPPLTKSVPAIQKTFKVVVIGDSGVGKTCFIRRFCQNEFRGTCGASVGIDFQSRCLVRGNEMFCLQLWDTAGQERFRSLTKQFFRQADGAIVIYDLTCDLSFQHVVSWTQSVKEEVGEKCVLMLIGNKLDLARENSSSSTMLSGQGLAQEVGALFFETSAKTGTGLVRALLALVDRLAQSSAKDTRDHQQDLAVKLDRQSRIVRIRKCCPFGS